MLPATLASPDATSTTWTYRSTCHRAATTTSRPTPSTRSTSRTPPPRVPRRATGSTPVTCADPDREPPVPGRGHHVHDGRIFVSGRAEDDQAMQNVEVAIVDSAGRYMDSSGAFPNTSESWRRRVRHESGHGRVELLLHHARRASGRLHRADAGDRQPRPGHAPRRPSATSRSRTRRATRPRWRTSRCRATRTSARTTVASSTDENAATLAYSWNFGNGTGSGALTKRTYTSANTYTVTLTVKDEWGVTSLPVSKTVTITEPTDNVAPTTCDQPACVHEPDLQLLRGRVGGQQRRRHVHLQVGLRHHPRRRRAPRPPRQRRSPGRAPTR